jgi:hypothetical protein
MIVILCGMSEATSALDAEFEALMQQVLDRVNENRTGGGGGGWGVCTRTHSCLCMGCAHACLSVFCLSLYLSACSPLSISLSVIPLSVVTQPCELAGGVYAT